MSLLLENRSSIWKIELAKLDSWLEMVDKGMRKFKEDSRFQT